MVKRKDGRSRNLPNGGNGRPKGYPNKLTKSAKEAFRLAFEDLGGAKALAAWAKDNLTDFYRLYARMIPTEHNIAGTEGAPLNFVLYIPPKAKPQE